MQDSTSATDQLPEKKCLFLFTELAGYVVACMKALAATGKVQVHVVRWPVNAVAPFQFSLEGKNLFFYERASFTDESLMEFSKNLNPDIIICSGWIDKGYMKVCKAFRKEIKTILTIDNPWRGTLKQHVASFAGPLYLQNYYSHCWVPGSPQRKFASKLGFPQNKITEGVYSADYDLYHQLYHEYLPGKKQLFPKRIIFVGRYTKLKGVKELWEAFISFHKEEPNEWELWCLGKGDMDALFPEHPKIKNFGFIQPGAMAPFISGTGVFILPSHYEHWGVVVHEYAAAGFPLICTTSTSAATTFLEEGKNGFFIDPCSTSSMVEVFKKINKLSSDQLLKMGDHSAELAKRITPQTWSNTVLGFIQNN